MKEIKPEMQEELIFVKLGGSLITDKQKPHVLQHETINRLAHEIALVKKKRPNLKLLIGHGAGSFGHYEAYKYQTYKGVYTPYDWLGFSELAYITEIRNQHVLNALFQANLPVISFQPSASIQCNRKKITSLSIKPIKAAITHGLVPLVRGDIAFDKSQGGTVVSTETVFRFLTPYLKPDRIILAGIEPGILSQYPNGYIIREISPQILRKINAKIGKSRATDVTGGMKSKVQEMISLVKTNPKVKVRVYDGRIINLTHDLLMNDFDTGTLIHI